MNFDDMFEDVFDDDNFEIVDFEIVDNEAIYNSLVEIFNKKGYDKQLNYLVLACLDFVALKTSMIQRKIIYLVNQILMRRCLSYSSCKCYNRNFYCCR